MKLFYATLFLLLGLVGTGHAATITADQFVGGGAGLTGISGGNGASVSNQTFTLLGTANQITVNAGAQSLNTNVTLTFSLPYSLGTFASSNAPITGTGMAGVVQTNATTVVLSEGGGIAGLLITNGATVGLGSTNFEATYNTNGLLMHNSSTNGLNYVSGRGTIAASGYTNSGNVQAATINSTGVLTAGTRLNVGGATDSSTFPAQIKATSASSTREYLFKASVSDDSTAGLYLANGSLTDSRFIPAFVGYCDVINTAQSLIFKAMTSSGNDTGASALTTFASIITTSASDPNNGTQSNPTARDLFSFGNLTTVVAIPANGALVASNNFSAAGNGTTGKITVTTAGAMTNACGFDFTTSWITALATRTTNGTRRAVLELDMSFVDTTGGAPIAKVSIEQNGAGGALTNNWILSAPSGIVSTFTNHYSLRVNTNAVVTISDISSGLNSPSVSISQAQLTME